MELEDLPPLPEIPPPMPEPAPKKSGKGRLLLKILLFSVVVGAAGAFFFGLI